MIPEKVKKHAESASKIWKRCYLRAWERGNKSDIIMAKCAECCGFENVSRRARECTVEICPIHPIRLRYFRIRPDLSWREKANSENE